jgi:hypothetical protein
MAGNITQPSHSLRMMTETIAPIKAQNCRRLLFEKLPILLMPE